MEAPAPLLPGPKGALCGVCASREALVLAGFSVPADTGHTLVEKSAIDAAAVGTARVTGLAVTLRHVAQVWVAVDTD